MVTSRCLEGYWLCFLKDNKFIQIVCKPPLFFIIIKIGDFYIKAKGDRNEADTLNRWNRLTSLILTMIMMVGITGCAQQIQQKSSSEGAATVALAQKDVSATGKRIYFAVPLFSEAERQSA